MKTIFRILLTYVIGGIVGFVLYVASFKLPIGGEILFYRGVLLAVLVAIALATLLAIGHRKLKLDLATAIGVVLTGLAFNVCFLVLFPVTIDRSISVFLLSRIEATTPITTAELKSRFVQEYVEGMDQIPRRVREQELSGNIALDAAGKIRLTDRGREFNRLARLASAWFGTDRRFVEAASNQNQR